MYTTMILKRETTKGLKIIIIYTWYKPSWARARLLQWNIWRVTWRPFQWFESWYAFRWQCGSPFWCYQTVACQQWRRWRITSSWASWRMAGPNLVTEKVHYSIHDTYISLSLSSDICICMTIDGMIQQNASKIATFFFQSINPIRVYIYVCNRFQTLKRFKR